MKTLILPALCSIIFLWGCADRSPQQTPAPVASTSAASVPAKLSVQRKTTPSALRAADEQACLAGKADACRRMADRYRGYGHPAGCGIERPNAELAYGKSTEPIRVRLKRAVDDTTEDEQAYLVWIAKACDLGDSDACLFETAVREKRGAYDHSDTEYAALRSDPNSSSAIAFHALWNADEHDSFVLRRMKCLREAKGLCYRLADTLLTRVDPAKQPELNGERMAKLQAIGDRTLDFDVLLMMLDKHGHAPEALAPLREHASKTLIQACTEGACVCGRAAESLPVDDPRVLDLARWGCENGEATGCHILAKLYEEGRGVEKDETLARSLDELACPAHRSISSTLLGDYSPDACAHLADMHEGGVMPPKRREHAVYYAEFACRNPGYEINHAHCVKLAKYWTSGVLTQTCYEYNREWCRNSAETAADIFYGPPHGVASGKECQRPSVKAACDVMEPDLVAMKKPGKKK